jgi:wyosine [tRNA(Phe)-imidazoG37] synthetase (radical SAM superfamily)
LGVNWVVSEMSHLFGPVPSRRLGRSLGVDLVPRKTCPFNCIYCEVGPTTHSTLERFHHQGGAILQELEEYLAGPGVGLDYITLAGSGEPTLNRDLGVIIRRLKSLTATPVAVLTNGALLQDREVRRELAAADVVLPSLDAAREETFQAINRPLPGLGLEGLVHGLAAFRQEYRGQIWLEVLLLKGLNDGEAELTALHRLLAKLAPDKVQLNTSVRPGVENWSRPLTRQEMAAAAARLGPRVEVIASSNGGTMTSATFTDADFVEMLSRRPMTAADLAQALGLPLPEVEERLRRLRAEGRISCDLYGEKEFYRHQSRAVF